MNSWKDFQDSGSGISHFLTFSILLQLLGDDKRSADDANAYAILDLIDALIQNSHRFVQYDLLKYQPLCSGINSLVWILSGEK